MGYTHYWKFTGPIRGKAQGTEKAYQTAIRKCQKLVSMYNSKIKAIDSEHEARLSGYSAHCKPGQYNGLKFNGTAELSHEDFCLREHYSQNKSFNFCKTANKPYDTVVTACLIVLKHYLGEAIDVDSDGYANDWTDGLLLAKKLLKLKSLKVPGKIESNKNQFSRPYLRAL